MSQLLRIFKNPDVARGVIHHVSEEHAEIIEFIYTFLCSGALGTQSLDNLAMWIIKDFTIIENAEMKLTTLIYAKTRVCESIIDYELWRYETLLYAFYCYLTPHPVVRGLINDDSCLAEILLSKSRMAEEFIKKYLTTAVLSVHFLKILFNHILSCAVAGNANEMGQLFSCIKNILRSTHISAELENIIKMYENWMNQIV